MNSTNHLYEIQAIAFKTSEKYVPSLCIHENDQKENENKLFSYFGVRILISSVYEVKIGMFESVSTYLLSTPHICLLVIYKFVQNRFLFLSSASVNFC